MGVLTKKKSVPVRTARIGLRATPQQEALIQRAAEATGKSVTEFVINSSCMAAENILLDQRLFFAENKSWSEFVSALEKPAKIKDGLKKMLKQRSPWDK